MTGAQTRSARQAAAQRSAARNAADTATGLMPAAPGLHAAWLGWLSHLADGRRLSDRTVEAYGRDLRQFFGFLLGHLGRQPDLADLGALVPGDVRAFLAARRRAGVAPQSVARTLSALKTFARHLRRTAGIEITALGAGALRRARRWRPSTPRLTPQASARAEPLKAGLAR